MRFEATPHRSVFERDRENVVHVRVEVEPDKSNRTERTPINLASVIDRSGSMSGKPLENAKEVQKYLVRNMASDDQIAVIEFGSDSKVVVPMSKSGSKEKIYKLIDQIAVNGCTNISSALLDAVDECKKVGNATGINRVILLSDGQANEGIVGEALVNRMRREIDEEGLTLSTFGLGDNYDVNLLSQLAEVGHGAFYHVSDPDEIHKFYAEEFGDILSVALTRGQVYVQSAHKAKVERMYGYELEEGEYWKVGSFYENETREFLVELKLTDADFDQPIVLAFEAETADGTAVVVNVAVDLSLGTQKESDESENLEVCKFADEIRQAFFIKEANRLRDEGDWQGAREVFGFYSPFHTPETYVDSGVADTIWANTFNTVYEQADHYYSNETRSRGAEAFGLFASSGTSYLSTALSGRNRKSAARLSEMVDDENKKKSKPVML